MTVEPRLYVDAPLASGAEIALPREAAHYLVNVMRRSPGDGVRVFNGRDGEWRAEVAEASKRSATLAVRERLRPQSLPPDLELFFAPVKRARTDFIVEKATELGARAITPVMTRRTIAERVRTDRLASIAREAAEQTERLDLPEVREPVSLDGLLDGWGAERRLIFCDEAGEDEAAPWGGSQGRARPMLEALLDFAGHPTPTVRSRGGSQGPATTGEIVESQSADAPPSPSGGEAAKPDPGDRATGRTSGGNDPGKWAVLIGPEGGFDPQERARLRGEGFVVPVTLGPRILRADTAAVAALTLWQATLGDWA